MACIVKKREAEGRKIDNDDEQLGMGEMKVEGSG